MFIDPENKRTRELLKWFENSKEKGTNFSSVTGGVGPSSMGGTNITNSAHGLGSGSAERPDNFKLADELIQELQYHSQRQNGYSGSFSDAQNKQQTRFYKISGFVKMIFNDEKILYLSCPDCRKKVIEEDGHWRCETCDKLHSTNLPTYMLSALISDVSGNVMVQFPRELGDSIMNGMSASDFKEMKDDLTKRESMQEDADAQNGAANGGSNSRDSGHKDSDALKEFFHSCTFKQHQILLKVRGDQPMGSLMPNNGNHSGGMEPRQKFFAAKVMPYSIQEENKMLLKRLSIYKQKMGADENGFND